MDLPPFHLFARAVEERFKALSGSELFVVDATGLFDTYLAAWPEGTNPIFRERTVHDCQCCKNFVRNLGRVVGVIGGKRLSVWDVEGLPEPYATVAAKMAAVVHQLPINSVYRTKERQYGADHNYDPVTNVRYDHFVGHIAAAHLTPKPDEARGKIGTAAAVLRRGLTELTASAFATVIDLIEAKSIYRGEEHLPAIRAFQALQRDYVAADDKELFAWANVDNRAALFRNTVIGTLLVDLSDGVDLEKAVKSFEAKVAPANYKRPKSLITPKMIEDAVTTLRELGLEPAIERRHARLSDVSVNNVLWVDNGVQAQMKDGIAGLLMEEVKAAPVDIKRATDITMDDFLATVLPEAKSIEVLVQNRHTGNFMSVTAPAHAAVEPLFRWDNGFAWSYDGEVADSIKQRVKRAGGNVDARLRVSLSWFNFDDLDLHCTTPRGAHIHFRDKMGILDVDMNAGGRISRTPVENMAFTGALQDGTYEFWVHQYAKRESIDVGFAAEIEFEGRLRQLTYDKVASGNTPLAKVIVKDNTVIEVSAGPSMRSSSASVDKWGVKTETLVKAKTLMASPNHWDGKAVGSKHWFFILDDCLNPDPVRGIYNEFLRPDLEPHRKVFEVLGGKTKCPPAPEQLSGVGFTAARGDTVTVVVKGTNLSRAFNIAF